MISPLRRTLVAVSIAVLTLGAAAGCGGKNSETDCSVNACTVTFDRGVDAEASILGVKAELVKVKGDQVTLKVAGQQVTVPVNGESNADGFKVAVQSVTKDKVKVRISQGGGG